MPVQGQRAQPGRIAIKVAVFLCIGLVLYLSVGSTTNKERSNRSSSTLRSPLFTSRWLLDSDGDNDVDDNDEENQCSIPDNVTDICQYVTENCSPNGLIDYLGGYYCSDIPRWGSWILYVLWLVVLFYFLAKCADTYFCPTLSIIAEKLHMSQEVAGLTILALGNGAPDVSSTIAAALTNNFDLGLGELFGAGLFVSSCVVGIVTLVTKEAPLDKHNFLRDIIFYLLAVVGVFFIAWDGNIYIWESIAFLAYYVGYVLFATLFHYCKRAKNRAEVINHSLNVSESIGESVPLLSDRSLEPEEEEEPFSFTRWKEDFKKQSLIAKIFTIVSAIIQLPIVVSTPTAQWNKYAAVLVPIGAPVATMLILRFITATVQFGNAAFPVVVFVILAGLVGSVVVFFTSKKDEPPVYHPLFVVIGFIMSIGWIYLAANELVNLLQTIGLIINVSQIVLGATVLSWGNSVGDLVSDVLLARKGYAKMAIAATYGGPLFNLLLGLGVSLTILTARQYPNPYRISTDKTFFVSAGFLFWGLWTSLIIISIRRFKLHWPVGIYLVLLYAVFSVILVLTELGVIWP